VSKLDEKVNAENPLPLQGAPPPPAPPPPPPALLGTLKVPTEEEKTLGEKNKEKELEDALNTFQRNK
jgi:hypothetical protein